MREQPTPCVYATRQAVRAGRHMTFNDDRVCDRCASTARVTGGRSGSAAAAPHSSPAGAYSTAPQAAGRGNP